MTTCPQTFSPAAKRFHGRLAVSALVAAASMAVSFQAAALTPVASRLALGADYTVGWAADDNTQVFPGVLAVAGFSPLPAVLASGANDLWIQHQGGALSGFNANFNDGEKLLTTGFADGPITISFTSGVRGVGFNIVNQTPGTFTGTMDFFNSLDVMVGSVSVTGVSSFAADGSAPFLGGVGPDLNIFKVVISVGESNDGVSNLAGMGLAINDLSLVTTPVPEPTSALLLAFGLAGLALHRKQRSSAPH